MTSYRTNGFGTRNATHFLSNNPFPGLALFASRFRWCPLAGQEILVNRPGMKHTGPMLFSNSLRDWQARYKARRTGSASESPRAGAPADSAGQTAGTLADGQAAGREAAPGR